MTRTLRLVVPIYVAILLGAFVFGKATVAQPVDAWVVALAIVVTFCAGGAFAWEYHATRNDVREWLVQRAAERLIDHAVIPDEYPAYYLVQRLDWDRLKEATRP